MASVSRPMRAPPERVFAELSDAWMYTSWVVGAAHIRGVDDGWPAAGTRLYHAVGGWPFIIRDSTRVIEVDPPRGLVLQARAWPAGEARIEVTIDPSDGGCVVHMHERPTSGPGRWLHNRITDKLLEKRNVEALERLACIAENRPMPALPRVSPGSVTA
jgi:uncharacterized protein YndB with AHSA1/START domain